MQNLPATSSTLQNEITELTKKLSPSGEDEVAKCINALLDAGLMIPSAVNEADAINLYRDALSATPVEGLRKVFIKLKRGEYSNHVRYLPNPAEMASLANAEIRTFRDDRARLSERMRVARENAALGVGSGNGLRQNPVTDARLKADKLYREGWQFHEKCSSQESWANRVKKGLPVGSIFLWAIGEIWSPAAKAMPAAERDAA